MKEKLQKDIELLRAELSKIDETAGLEEPVEALKAAIDRLQKA